MDQQNDLFLQQLLALQQQTLSPAALADRELTALWANKAAQTQYPLLATLSGFTRFLGDRKQQALINLENGTPYLCTPSLPMVDYCLYLTPIIGPENVRYTQVAFIPSPLPVPGNFEGIPNSHPYHAFSQLITNSAQELSVDLESLYTDVDSFVFPLPQSQKINDFFNRLRQNTRYLSRSARNIEAFYNSFYSAPSVPVKQTNLSAFLEEICKSAELLAEKVGYRFDALLPEYTVFALVNQEELSLALYNGISNALNFAQRGERITVALQAREKDSLLEFSVTNGNGGLRMPNYILDRAFEPFYSCNPSVDESSSRPVGQGLGLSVVQSFAEKYGGTASLRSTAEETVLTFSIAWLQNHQTPLQLFDSCLDAIQNPNSLFNVMLCKVAPPVEDEELDLSKAQKKQ